MSLGQEHTGKTVEKSIEITVLSGPSKGDVFRFTIAENSGITIGRASDSDMVLQDPKVSRKHARIEFGAEGVSLVDLGSSLGTIHMGFPLTAGDAGRRRMSDEDEFKVGEAIFRISFEEEKRPASPIAAATRAAVEDSPVKQQQKKRRIRLAALGLVAVFGVAFLLMPGDGNELPKQHSDAVLSLPQMKVVGYFKGSEKKERDLTHLDKAQFSLPASDALIEYDLFGTAPIDVFADQANIAHIDALTGDWIRGSLIVRDPLVGYERKLIVDNLGYPSKGQKRLQWAIRNTRATPLAKGDKPIDELLKLAAVQAERIDLAPEGLFTLLRTVQTTTLGYLHLLAQDAVYVPISTDSPPPNLLDLKRELDAIRNEYLGGGKDNYNDMLLRHLRALVALSGSLDAELWRRVDLRVRQARHAAKVKEYITAHDALVGIKKMFPDETDYRAEMAANLFEDKKIVPKSIKKNPEKYRKVE